MMCERLPTTYLPYLTATATIGAVYGHLIGPSILYSATITTLSFIVADRVHAKRLTGSWLGEPSDLDDTSDAGGDET